MNIEKLENDLQSLVVNLSKKTFIYDLLLAYDQPKASITRLQKGDYNLAEVPGEILWKKKLFFKKETDSDLHSLIDKLKSDPAIARQHPRFIVVTDFQMLLSVDTKTEDTLDIPIPDLAKHCDFFLPWAGREKSQLQSENPADIKAAERMGRLYDLILQDNSTGDEAAIHVLNIFLSRLLFCFFAEDTCIFKDAQFTNAIASRTAEDGSDLQPYLQKFFKALNLDDRSDYPQFLQNFPYVNGGLFAGDHPVPKFSAKSRKIIIECGALNWKAINPDIFGSMMQAVVHSDQRGKMGMHYTSVVNIMKVIEPLFLNELYEALEKAEHHKKKLKKLLDRLYRLRIFDPACGSGNFLIIAFKELCKLEIEVFKRLYGHQLSFRFTSNIRLSQFYGIELDDFAHETAKLSLWLTEHQMNLAFKEVFGEAKPTLPLQDGGNIVRGNATRLDWEVVCPKNKGYEIYILGNPPYLGARNQNNNQKSDVKFILSHIKGYNNLDYIACWFIKAAKYIEETIAKFSFVSTNSISQGAQAAILWPYVLDSLEIGFARCSFKWTNSARNNAGVTCVIIGVRNNSNKPKHIYSNGIKNTVESINAYLLPIKDIYINERRNTLSKIPNICFGNMPNDGSHLFIDKNERSDLLNSFPDSHSIIRKALGSKEYINGIERWCLWIDYKNIEYTRTIKPIAKKIELVKRHRLSSNRAATRKLADIPFSFAEVRHQNGNSIIVPRHSSENRKYIPIGFLDSRTIILDSALAIYNARPYIFAIISSRIHMTWIRAVAGRLKTDYRYSSSLCYNTFPFPEISEAQESTLEDHVFKVLDEREQHSEKTMAQLYDPDKMPEGLRQAHHEMDLAVEKCYRPRPFKSDEERLEYLFKLYEDMIRKEKQK